MARLDSPDAKTARVLSHPLRPQILDVLVRRGEASPNEIATELGVPLGTLSYHTRLLRDHGWIELTREVPRRGAVEHFYRAVVQPDARWISLKLDEQGWAELTGLLTDVSDQANAIQERSSTRRSRKARSSKLAILHFASPE
jgi:DNA-binding transcriptional ArsR family regulator